MNVKRFTGRNSREAMQKVKAAFGNDAVVLSTKPAAEGGIEILAMAADSVPAVDHLAAQAAEAGHGDRRPGELFARCLAGSGRLRQAADLGDGQGMDVGHRGTSEFRRDEGVGGLIGEVEMRVQPLHHRRDMLVRVADLLELLGARGHTITDLR